MVQIVVRLESLPNAARVQGSANCSGANRHSLLHRQRLAKVRDLVTPATQGTNRASMADPFSSTLPGVACDPARGIHFSIENLREIPGLSEAERQHRRRAMKALFGFLTYERIASEFRASVAPFYYLMDHSEAMDIGDFVAKLLNEWPARSTSPPTWEPKHKLSPLDVFSLPFRHLVLNETLEVLSLHYGIACAPVTRVC